MAKNDCPGDGQTLPGALARRLGGEKHLEQPALVLGGNADTGIRNRDFNIAVHQSGRDIDSARIPILGFADGLRRVNDEIYKNLINFTFYGIQRREIVIEPQIESRNVFPLA